MQKLGLRFKLIIFSALISLTVFTAAGVLSWKECSKKIGEFFDTYQIALARQLSTADWTHLIPETQTVSDKLVKSISNAESEEESIGFAVFDNAGKRVFHDGEKGRDFPPFGSTGRFGTERIDGEDWRVIRLTSTDRQYIVAVGQELDFRTEIVEEMFEEFMTPWGVGLCVLLAAIIIMLTKEFSSLNRLAARLKTRAADDLSPIDETNIPAEVTPLTGAVNRLFGRIETMLQRERHFITDSAHELRSPLSALKVQLEVAQMSADNPEAIRESLQKLEQGINRSTRLVEQLLAFSRIEAGSDALPRDNVPLNWRQIVNRITDECASAADAKQITISERISDCPPFKNGNPVWVSLMLRNLVDNAVKYSPNGATVIIAVKDGAVSVCNSDTVVAPEQLKCLGQRFYRPAGQKVDGSGLGLSIVLKIASVYHCQTDFANTPNGFCVTIRPQTK